MIWKLTRRFVLVALLGILQSINTLAGNMAPIPSSSQGTALQFVDYKSIEFSPNRGENFAIQFAIDKPATQVELRIFTSDSGLVRTLTKTERLEPGQHKFSWDGKDNDGIIVPDEAYVPVLKSVFADDEVTLDPRETSGGEQLEGIRVKITPSQDIGYYLPVPSRVLIRAGIKGGAMLRTLTSWTPHGAGKNIQRWDGRDQNGLKDIRGEKDLTVLVMGFKLPKHAIITMGNQDIDYRRYRDLKGWEIKKVSPENMQLNRDGVRISRHYYFPRAFDPVPRVTLELPDGLPRSTKGLPELQLKEPVAVKANIVKEDRWMMKESLYEVAFFVNHEFAAEEEQGYVPLTWRWTPTNLSPGEHMLTVNISGFSGKVGVANLLFEIAE